jgi:hypothetical protein
MMTQGSEIVFNPEAFAVMRTDPYFPISFVVDGKESRVWLDRPKGDIYAALDEYIDRAYPSDNDFEYMKRSLRVRLICVAALDRAMPSEAIRIVEVELAHFMPSANLRWRLLELFRSVGRMADALQIDLPDVIRNDVQAWAKTALYCFDVGEEGPYSKREMTELIRPEVKALKQGQNPYSETLIPELFHLIEWAHRLTKWDAEREAQGSNKLPNYQKRRLGQLRRDIKNNLAAYRQALSTLATHLDRSPGLAMVRPGPVPGTARIVGDNNKHIRAIY